MIFQAFGPITNPLDLLTPPGTASPYTGLSGKGGGLIILANNLIKFAIVIGGIYALVNMIFAGYTFLSATESKEVAKAWAKIWQSMVGLLVMAGAFVLAGIFGWIIFGDASALLVPKLYGP